MSPPAGRPLLGEQARRDRYTAFAFKDGGDLDSPTRLNDRHHEIETACTLDDERVKSRGVVYDVVVWLFDGLVQAVRAAGVASCSLGVSLTARDLLRTSRPR